MNTPLTDAALFAPGMGNQSEELVNADFARQLERDRARLLEALMKVSKNDPFCVSSAGNIANAVLASLEIKDTP